MNRITEVPIGTALAGILGDPHLGRSFVRGVPLNRRGEREKMQMEEFRSRLAKSGSYDVFICMGDLFDKWAVPYSIVFQAAITYLEAARKNPSTEYFVIAGNHDISRDLEKKGALDLFELIVGDLDNVTVVRHTDLYVHEEIGGVEVGFFPYHPTIPAEELVTGPLDIAFGHWDTMFGEDNMIPTKKLAEMGCATAYTGHIHLPDSFTRDGVEVFQVGSMQPYAHGEESDSNLYITLAKDELEETFVDFSNKCLRILLAPGERLEQEIDCLQLTIKRTGVAEEDEAEGVTMGDFNLMTLFGLAFEEACVPDEVRSQILTRFEEARVAE